ncbi:ABC transporter ATP-binding protein [Blastopirellula retiformator]|uniref:Teichoic acids export ATP-binding protein TagH n=1 Tax=Blastopirellula retiformator TaxID=2527970 RepID=A0A5C5V7M2_9BACT|nr:ABC transporter ATP-binding protein [Blastopirellula retiformator]TWT34574.1 Teichoic acids export ATP-binding protein TagH [Blastopirellula retiformator]
MSNIAIRVENLGKRYRRGADAPYHRFSELLQRIPSAAIGAARGVFQPNNKSGAIATADRSNEFWALKDVSFDVQEGEVLGVIGRNGAGKSTLLKILSRITEPTTGRFGVRGRLASLLEVGTGFHPELTGRENIYLSGTILGMSRAEIKRHFDEIVVFAEIEEALDTPVKRYSSGMYVRLGFAIAAHLQPEILIVDEVLAVGDAAFQKKCLGKMGDIARTGQTVIFVSHLLPTIRQLTNRCLLLERGRLVFCGNTSQAIDRYVEGSQQASVDTNHRNSEFAIYRRDDQCGFEVRITSVGIRKVGGDQTAITPVLEFGEDFEFVCEIESQIETKARLGFSIARSDGSQVTLVWSQDANFELSLCAGRQTVSCRVKGLPLAPGKYLSQIGIADTAIGRTYDVLVDYPLLDIHWHAIQDGSLHYPNRSWGGIQWSDVEWSIQEAMRCDQDADCTESSC